MGRKPTKQLTTTAYHEAGHVVAAYRLGVQFVSATIEPKKDYLGMVSFERLRKRVFDALEFGGVTPQLRDKIERHIIVSHAGGVAERRCRGRHNHQGSAFDRQNILDFAERLSGSTAEMEAYIEWLHQRAINVINLYWSDVEAIAQALLETPTLRYDAIVEVIEEAARRRWDPVRLARISEEVLA